MFISKWKYEMNLDNARLQGMRAGRAEAVSEYHDMVKKLEAENTRLENQNAAQWDENERLKASLKNARQDLEHAYKDLSAMQSLLEQQAEVMIPKSTVIWNFAEELACAQKRADAEYYINHDTEKAGKLIAVADLVKERASIFGICQEVYEAAYTIYDFRNSGREGYTLKDGKIVKVEEATQEQATQETAVEETETPSECCEEAVEETAVECPFCDDAQPGDCCQENNGMIHETD